MAAVCRQADMALALVSREVFRMLHFGETSVLGISAILVGMERFGHRGLILGIVGIGRWMLMGTGVVIRRKPANPTRAQPRKTLWHQ
jgi:hypothetical protein